MVAGMDQASEAIRHEAQGRASWRVRRSGHAVTPGIALMINLTTQQSSRIRADRVTFPRRRAGHSQAMSLEPACNRLRRGCGSSPPCCTTKEAQLDASEKSELEQSALIGKLAADVVGSKSEVALLEDARDKIKACLHVIRALDWEGLSRQSRDAHANAFALTFPPHPAELAAHDQKETEATDPVFRERVRLCLYGMSTRETKQAMKDLLTEQYTNPAEAEIINEVWAEITANWSNDDEG